MLLPGDPVHGEVHFTAIFATTTKVIPLYEAGSNVVRTLASDEYLDIDSISLVRSGGAAGDVYVYLGTVAAGLAAGQTVVRCKTNKVQVFDKYSKAPRSGVIGAIPICVATTCTVDVVLTGRIRKA